MTDTDFQPTLPPETAPTDAELEFEELSPGSLFPQNQDSNFGFAIRKIWTDRVQAAADQQTLMFNEKFPATSSQFLDDHERQYGLPVAPSTLTISQRRQQVLNRIRVGPFTRTRLKNLVESYLQITFGTPIQLTPDGVALNPNGLPLYGEGGPVNTLYSIIEDIPNFHFTILIKNTITPDEAGLRRDLDRMVPAHISYSISFFSGTFIAPLTSIFNTTTVSGRVPRRFRVLPSQISSTSTISAGLQKAGVQARVNSLSSVSGKVVARRRITGAVSTHSTVSGAVSKSGSLNPAAFIQSVALMPSGATAQGTSYSQSINVTAGNYLVIHCWRWAMSSQESLSLSDGGTNVYDRTTGPIDTVDNGFGPAQVGIDTFVTHSALALSGTLNITATLGVARAFAMVITEVSSGGVLASSVVMNAASGAQGTDNLTSGNPPATTQNNSLAVTGICNGFSGQVFNPGTGFTSQVSTTWNQDGGSFVGVATKALPTSGAVQAGLWSQPSATTQDYAAGVVIFKPGGNPTGGGGGGGGGTYSGSASGTHVWGSWYNPSAETDYAKLDIIGTDANDQGAGSPGRLPGVKVLLYRSALSVGIGFDTSIDWNNANSNGWLLRDSGGTLLTNTGSGGTENILDPSIPAVATAIGNHAVSLCQAGGWAGVDLDDVVAGYAPTLMGSMPAGFTYDQWYLAVVAHTRRIAKIVRAAGLYIIANASAYIPGGSGAASGYTSLPLGSAGSDDSRNQIKLYQDLGAAATSTEQVPNGISTEYWLQFTWQAGVQTLSSGNWTNARSLHSLCNSLGCDFSPSFHMPSAGDSADTTYAKATFLLDWTGGNSCFFGDDDSSADPYGPVWCKKMGTALDSASLSGSTWTRHFANGTVTVNPSAGTASIT